MFCCGRNTSSASPFRASAAHLHNASIRNRGCCCGAIPPAEHGAAVARTIWVQCAPQWQQIGARLHRPAGSSSHPCARASAPAWAHRTRVERPNWRCLSTLCSDRYGSRLAGIFQTILQPVLRVHAAESPSHSFSHAHLVGQSCAGGRGSLLCRSREPGCPSFTCNDTTVEPPMPAVVCVAN